MIGEISFSGGGAALTTGYCLLSLSGFSSGRIVAQTRVVVQAKILRNPKFLTARANPST